MVSFNGPWPTVDQMKNHSLDGIGRDLERLAAHVRHHVCPSHRSQPRTEAELAQRLLKERRERNQVFGGDLFGEPAWDMLLDLFASEAAGKRVSISSLCIASGTPPTTALRWIAGLVDRGMLQRRADPDDQRRIYVDLEPKTKARVESLLASWLSAMR